MLTIGKFFIIIGFLSLCITSYNFLFCSDSNILIEEANIIESSKDSIFDIKKGIRLKIKENNLSGIDIPILIDDYMRDNFSHRTVYVSLCDNWLLVVLDAIFPDYYFNVELDTDKIALTKSGICSQNATVFQEIVKDFGFVVGSVRFSSSRFKHFASAVLVDKDWYFFDPNQKPSYDRRNPDIFKKIISSDKVIIKRIYSNQVKNGVISVKNLKKGEIALGDINKFPAYRGLLVQNITLFFSQYAWILFIFIGIIFIVLSDRKKLVEDE